MYAESHTLGMQIISVYVLDYVRILSRISKRVTFRTHSRLHVCIGTFDTLFYLLLYTLAIIPIPVVGCVMNSSCCSLNTKAITNWIFMFSLSCTSLSLSLSLSHSHTHTHSHTLTHTHTHTHSSLTHTLTQVSMSRFDPDKYINYERLAENLKVVKDRYAIVYHSTLAQDSLLELIIMCQTVCFKITFSMLQFVYLER